ncbi:MAG: nucleoside-diphosphate kinase [Candidatus Micrarchaeia archaeon]|jgi:nucleoside-diphosphate kinase
MTIQKTLILLKPDALQRGIIGQITSRFETRGLHLSAIKMIKLDEKKCAEHYAHLTDKPFYPKLVKFMTSAPVVAMVVGGVDAVQVVRDMCGPTNARKAMSGTIRGDFSLSTQFNVIHASDSLETAEKEVKRFFDAKEIFAWNRTMDAFTAAEDEK